MSVGNKRKKENSTTRRILLPKWTREVGWWIWDDPNNWNQGVHGGRKGKTTVKGGRVFVRENRSPDEGGEGVSVERILTLSQKVDGTGSDSRDEDGCSSY